MNRVALANRTKVTIRYYNTTKVRYHYNSNYNENMLFLKYKFLLLINSNLLAQSYNEKKRLKIDFL
jgi:hypothetical protein